MAALGSELTTFRSGAYPEELGGRPGQDTITHTFGTAGGSTGRTLNCVWESSSVFNTELDLDLGISTMLCNWILDFLANTGVPQGGVPSPMWYSSFTYDYVAFHTPTLSLSLPTTPALSGVRLPAMARRPTGRR